MASEIVREIPLSGINRTSCAGDERQTGLVVADDDREREREYSPSSCIGGNYQPFIDEYRSRSHRAGALGQADGVAWHSINYGPQPSNRIELCVPVADVPAPVLVFIHGGYWQELSAADSLFGAEELTSLGIAWAAVDYTLAPIATIADIVEECRRAVRHLSTVARDHGIDPMRIVLAGSSAGAHLAAMVALDPLGPPLAGLFLLSGVYWLEPLVGTTINDALGLDAAMAASLSPGLLPVSSTDPWPPTVVAWGEIETDSFKQQSINYAEHLRAHGVTVTTIEVSGRNHFDVVFELAAGDRSAVGASVVAWTRAR